MQTTRTPVRTTRIRSGATVFGLAIGAAALAVLAAGPAAAESLSRGSNSAGQHTATSNTGDHNTGRHVTPGDTTGIHQGDPFGYMHRDANPLRQLEHQDALRDFHAQPRADPTGPATNGNGAATWEPVTRADGPGYTVCPVQASHC
ncbi:hypothetical protein ACIP5Y_04515 [Nocardia sp. NPDC088792]|uniref:hypothetical protein n=1 Tax=Nocardia sp. NPDC088792 TaxID=3364332 RepID=UPI00380D2F23